MAHLVVVVGPIGAGKSTVVARLAQLVRRNTMTAADVDMDDVAFMQCGGDDVNELWRRAAVATAGLVRAWFDAGLDVVITHGPFFESDGFEILRHARAPDVEVHHVLLRVTADVGITRVQDDPTRGISKDPTFVRDSNDRFQRLGDVLPVMDLELSPPPTAEPGPPPHPASSHTSTTSPDRCGAAQRVCAITGSRAHDVAANVRRNWSLHDQKHRTLEPLAIRRSRAHHSWSTQTATCGLDAPRTNASCTYVPDWRAFQHRGEAPGRR